MVQDRRGGAVAPRTEIASRFLMTCREPAARRAVSGGWYSAFLLLAAGGLGVTQARPVGPPVTDAGRASTTSRPGSRVAVPLTVAGHAWWYRVVVPGAAEYGSPLPVVVILHGMGGSGQTYLDLAGWSDQAIDGAFLAVAPDALPMRPGLESNVAFNPRIWNSGQHGDRYPRSRIDDLEFFDAMLADVARRWPVDQRRIYVVGHSNGGSMAFRLGARRADRIAAIGVVAGHCWIDDPRPKRPVPTLWMVGTRDPLMPLHGGTSVLPWEVRRTPPLSQTITRWTRALGIPDTPRRTDHSPGLWVRDYGNDADPELFRLILLDGHGHGWPGHPGSRPAAGRPFFGPDTASIDATRWIWRFLRRQSLPLGPEAIRSR